MQKIRVAAYHEDFMGHADKQGAAGAARFFKTGKGQYGEGDRFLGITVPTVRKLVARYQDLGFDDLGQIMGSPWHEERLGALRILADRSAHAQNPAELKKICTFYLKHIKGINNWDLVDTSAASCVGRYLATLDPGAQQKFLKKLIVSKNMWERRIAIVATFHFTRNRISDLALWVSAQLLDDEQDLIHKASGWMLREFGKHASEPALIKFLHQYVDVMPRTMLRYSLERLERETRAYFMKKRPA